jgi:dienelactone hydrolase
LVDIQGVTGSIPVAPTIPFARADNRLSSPIGMPIASHVRADVRRRRVAALISALLLVAPLSLPALAAPPASVETAAQEIAEIATTTGATLHVRTFRPAGKGSAPLAIVNHGSPVNASHRQSMEIPVFPPVSNWLLGHGYAVALPLRRGYGQTGGPWFENYGSCTNPDYYRAGLASADDIAAVMGFFRARSDIERDRTLLIGWSAGGWGSIAAISRSPIGVRAVLNFAGGRGGNPAAGNCAPERLVAAAGRYGATKRLALCRQRSVRRRRAQPQDVRCLCGGGRARRICRAGGVRQRRASRVHVRRRPRLVAAAGREVSRGGQAIIPCHGSCL